MIAPLLGLHELATWRQQECPNNELERAKWKEFEFRYVRTSVMCGNRAVNFRGTGRLLDTYGDRSISLPAAVAQRLGRYADEPKVMGSIAAAGALFLVKKTRKTPVCRILDAR